MENNSSIGIVPNTTQVSSVNGQASNFGGTPSSQSVTIEINDAEKNSPCSFLAGGYAVLALGAVWGFVQIYASRHLVAVTTKVVAFRVGWFVYYVCGFFAARCLASRGKDSRIIGGRLFLASVCAYLAQYAIALTDAFRTGAINADNWFSVILEQGPSILFAIGLCTVAVGLMHGLKRVFGLGCMVASGVQLFWGGIMEVGLLISLSRMWHQSSFSPQWLLLQFANLGQLLCAVGFAMLAVVSLRKKSAAGAAGDAASLPW